MALTYYNEIDKYCCQWLENLMHAGHIPLGVVDDRPIQEVKAHDLEPYTACHFFAGLGGWAYALRLAAWDDDEPVWTGSCPCQPFSVAGKRRGTEDERHLWPYFFALIAECNPPVVFGEQVASKDGKIWLSGVRSDLEALDYRAGAADLCAAGVGSPTIRQRLYWLAESESSRVRDQGRGPDAGAESRTESSRQEREWLRDDSGYDNRRSGRPADHCGSGLAVRGSDRRVQREAMGAFEGEATVGSGTNGGVAFPGSQRARRGLLGPAESSGTNGGGTPSESGRSSSPGRLDDSTDPRQPRQRISRPAPAPRDETRLQEPPGRSSFGRVGNTERYREVGSRGQECLSDAAGPFGFWSDYDVLPCLDGKSRRVEPGTFPLAHGIPARVGKLRAYGNAIVPQVAAEFIRAYREIV